MKAEALGEEIKIRVPKELKDAIQKLAAVRHVKPAAVAREAFREYLAKHAKSLRNAA